MPVCQTSPQALARALTRAKLQRFAAPLAAAAESRLAQPHGDDPKWRRALAALPDLLARQIDLNADAPRAIGDAADAAQLDALRAQLQCLQPWRKGPFDLFGVYVDAEWRADMKWRRIADKITPLAGRRVLDVGCGNGYYLFRMQGAGAEFALGLDPSRLFLHQFCAVQKYLRASNVFFAQASDADLPRDAGDAHGFDGVFSMGVLYHRKDAMRHLHQLCAALRRGGELVLETLIIPGDEDAEFAPRGRYAQMRNVHALPTLTRLQNQLRAAGLAAVTPLDVSRTTPDEQRATEWMRFDSLENFLDPSDSRLTIEGHPAPLRAALKATKK